MGDNEYLRQQLQSAQDLLFQFAKEIKSLDASRHRSDWLRRNAEEKADRIDSAYIDTVKHFSGLKEQLMQAEKDRQDTILKCKNEFNKHVKEQHRSIELRHQELQVRAEEAAKKQQQTLSIWEKIQIKTLEAKHLEQIKEAELRGYHNGSNARARKSLQESESAFWIFSSRRESDRDEKKDSSHRDPNQEESDAECFNVSAKEPPTATSSEQSPSSGLSVPAAASEKVGPSE
jgi:hypothetical protein